MSVTLSIFLLHLVTMATGTTPDVEGYLELMGIARNFPPATASNKYMWDVITATRDYLCAIRNPECAAYVMYVLEEDLWAGDINCDETPDNKLCEEARLLLRSDALSDQEIHEGLVAAANVVLAETHENFSVMDSMRIALFDVVCAVESQEVCDFWR